MKNLLFFFNVTNDEMILNRYGDIAKNSWLDLPNHHNGTEFDQFIIIINNPAVGNGPARSYNKYQKRNNLSVIIGSCKSTKQINRINRNYTFKWQKSFHDHIIRVDKSLNNIRNYIINNPTTWGMDENNIQNYSLDIRTIYGTLIKEVKNMTFINASQARANLYKLLDKTAITHEPIQITGKRHNAVLISEDDWRSINETLYLLSIPGIRKSIRKGLKTSIRKCSKRIKW